MKSEICIQGSVAVTADMGGYGWPIKMLLEVKQSFCPGTYFLKNLPFTIFHQFLENKKIDFFGFFSTFPKCVRIDDICFTIVLEHHNDLKECIFG